MIFVIGQIVYCGVCLFSSIVFGFSAGRFIDRLGGLYFNGGGGGVGGFAFVVKDDFFVFGGGEGGEGSVVVVGFCFFEGVWDGHIKAGSEF